MTWKELSQQGTPEYLTTITDPWGYPEGLAYPDGTIVKCAPSNVGTVVKVPLEGWFEIVWDGSMPDPKGGMTKGQIL